MSGSIDNNDNDGKVDSNSNNSNNNKSSSGKISHKKGYPSDSSDHPSASSKKSKGNARRIPKKKKKSTDLPHDLSSSSSDSSSYNHKCSYKDHSSSSADTKYKKKKRKYNRRVKRSKWLDTSAAAIQIFSNSQIHPNSTDKFYCLRQLHTVGLLTLVQGHRTRPLIKQDKNKHGYRKQKVLPYTPPVVAGVDLSFTISNTKDIILEEDDIYCYTYDVDRLYSLLDTIFRKDCRHYVSNEAHQERDGVIAFDQIISNVFGQRQQDILIAENNITLFKVDQNKTVRSEFIRWETLFNNLSYANNKKISSETKLAFLAKHISGDGRPLIVSSFAASMNNRLGYDITMANILWVADALPPHIATEQLAAVRTAYQPPDPSWDNAQLASLYGTGASSQAETVDPIPKYIAEKIAGESPQEKTAQY